MSTDSTLRLVAVVLAGALLSACGGNVTAPGGTQVTVAVKTTPAVSSGSPLTRTTASGVSGAQPANTAGPVTAQPNRPSVDVIQVDKCYTNATTNGDGQMLIKAKSSDPTARLSAYRPDGTLIGELQNGGGNRYGGTVIPYQPSDPVRVTIKSSAGGSTTVATTPFQLEN